MSIFNIDSKKKHLVASFLLAVLILLVTLTVFKLPTFKSSGFKYVYSYLSYMLTTPNGFKHFVLEYGFIFALAWLILSVFSKSTRLKDNKFTWSVTLSLVVNKIFFYASCHIFVTDGPPVASICGWPIKYYFSAAEFDPYNYAKFFFSFAISFVISLALVMCISSLENRQKSHK